MAERITGSLQSFNGTPGKAHGYVRLTEGLLVHVPVSNRGVLQKEGKIKRCMNGDRYDPIEPFTVICLDVEYDRKGQNPFVVAWAPKPQKPGAA